MQEVEVTEPYTICVKNCYKCKWEEKGFCEAIQNKDILDYLSERCENIILKTGAIENFILKDKTIYKIQIDGKIRNMWICDIIMAQEEPEVSNADDIEDMDIIYARCLKSMLLLDPLMREHLKNIEYENNMNYAIKAVAGSGKTTMLLDIAKENSGKRILYLAFNKSIVVEVRKKKNKVAKNIQPYTFDALMRRLFIENNPDKEFELTDFRALTIGDIPGYEILDDKRYATKQDIINIYNRFCKNTAYNNMDSFIRDKCGQISNFKRDLLIRLWNDTKKNKIITFNSIRKLTLYNRWFKKINNLFDIVFIDEAQDFDPLMLRMLNEQCHLPRVFVGDQRQAIYKWRGAIDTFKQLPNNTHEVELYKTWRIGNPACEKIRNKFTDCWMVAGTNNETNLYEGTVREILEPYHYLFRSWRGLLTTASKMSNIWINDFRSKREAIKKLHPKLLKYGKDAAMEFEDDLPNFLLKLSPEDLSDLILNIETNLVDKRKATCHMYTIHSYKGLENDTIRIFNDIDLDKDEELYYVALTRGKKNIYLDE